MPGEWWEGKAFRTAPVSSVRSSQAAKEGNRVSTLAMRSAEEAVVRLSNDSSWSHRDFANL